MKMRSFLWRARSALALVVGTTVSTLSCSDADVAPREGQKQQPYLPVRIDEGGSNPSSGWSSTEWAVDRVNQLIAPMTLAEKISQLQHEAPAIQRLGIPQYNYWSEALHGVLADRATSFPSPIALGATWDPALVERVATAISDEARGINARDGKGLTYWSPVINMARDPRWGRNEESYGEDPFLMSSLGVSFVRGMQGNHIKYLKTVATPKHFALNNSEYNRHTGSSDVDEQTLWEYYLPAFEATIREGHAFSIMAAYNRVNQVPSAADPLLLDEILRKNWGFPGYVVSDCDAVSDIFAGHHWVPSLAQAAAEALQAGTDLNCGTSYPAALGEAIDRGLATEADVDRALRRVLSARVYLGEFDAPELVPYRAISPAVVESEANAALALEAAQKSIVLLKNDSHLLPLDSKQLTSIAVIGPHGNDVTLGGYSGNPSHSISAFTALTQKLGAAGNVRIQFAPGATVTGSKTQEDFDAAVNLARTSDVALVFAGTNLDVLREEMDRPNWSLPGVQSELIQAVAEANPRTVLVLVTAGPLGVDWAKAHVPAILTGFYGGQEQGMAIANVLFGDTNPGGKLSTTWYKDDATLPPIGDYDLRKGRTYLYYPELPLYAFGHGLSYTHFSYSKLTLSRSTIAPSGEATASVAITNDGDRAGDEVAQLYIRDLEASVPRPIQQLRGFSRIHLEPGETQTVNFPVRSRDLAFWDVKTHDWQVEEGEFELRIGASSADIRGTAQLFVSKDAALGTGGNGATSVGEAPAPGQNGSGGTIAQATPDSQGTPDELQTKASGGGCSACTTSTGRSPGLGALLLGTVCFFWSARRRRSPR